MSRSSKRVAAAVPHPGEGADHPAADQHRDHRTGADVDREHELDLVTAQAQAFELAAVDVGPQHRAPGLDHVQHPAIAADALPGRGQHQRLAQLGLTRRVAVGEPGPHHLALRGDDVEHRVVGHLRHRQPHQLAERGGVIERGVEQPGGVGEKALFLGVAPPAADVEERADGAARPAVVVEQRRRVLEQRDARAVGAVDVHFHAAHRQPGPRRPLQRQLLGGQRGAIGPGDAHRNAVGGVRRLRDVSAGRHPQHLGQRPIGHDATAVDVLGDAQADRRLLEQRGEVAGPALRVAGQPILRLPGLGQLLAAPGGRLGLGLGASPGVLQVRGEDDHAEADGRIERQAHQLRADR